MSENNRYMNCCEYEKCECNKCEKKEYPKKEMNYCNQNKHYPEKKHIECCCKPSMKKALELLGCEGIRENVDFNAFAFITDYYVVGSPLSIIGLLPALSVDNLFGTLTGSLNKLPGCECDTIDISGQALYPIPLPVDDPVALLNAIIAELTALDPVAFAALITLLQGIVTLLGTLTDEVLEGLLTLILDLITTIPNVDLASLCNLKAIAFQSLAGDVPGTTPPVTRFQAVRQAFKCLLGKECKKDDCNPKCEECCCNEGILKELADGNITGTATLTAGALSLQGAEVLGSIDNVIVLANEAERKFYFVCADAVSLIG